MSVLSPVGMLWPRRLKPIIFHYFHFTVLMGKRKEERFSNPGSQKRQRRENTNVQSDESSEEETLGFSADNNASSQSVSNLKNHRDEDVRKVLCVLK